MSLLEQAIIDAQELKEAALRSAESAILEKYSFDIKEAVDAMLEQDEEEDPLAAMMGGMPMPEEEEELPEEEIPFAAEAELKLCPCPDDEAQVEISFKELELLSQELAGDEAQEPEEALAMAMGAEEEEEDAIPMMESIELDDLLEACGEMMPMDSMAHPMDHEEEDGGDGGDGGDVNTITINLEEAEMSSRNMTPSEDIDMDDMDIDMDMDMSAMEEAIVEKVLRDLSGQKNGWQATADSVAAHEEEKELAGRGEDAPNARESELEEEFEIRLAEATNAKDAQIKDLKGNLQTLAASSDKLKQTFMLMREQFEKTNLSNAKLLYTNRTLKSTSLNERQKNRIAESIQSADTIEEAKVIFETLQSAVGESRKSTPKSLNEAIKKPSISMPRRRRESSSRESVVKNRFQALAGIKK